MQLLKTKFSRLLEKTTKNDHLAETICLGILFYLVLFIFAFLLGKSITSNFSSDKAAVISNFFVWSATLFAPIVVILLINSWKVQKDFELKKEFSLQLLKDLQPLFVELIEIRSISFNIFKSSDELVLYKSFLEGKYLDLSKEAYKCYSNINTITKLYSSTELDSLYNKLEKHCQQVDFLFSELNHGLYQEYYDMALTFDISYIKFNKNKFYKHDERERLIEQIRKIERFRTLPRGIKVSDRDGKNEKIFAKYDNYEELLNETIEIHNKILNTIISLISLTPKN